MGFTKTLHILSKESGIQLEADEISSILFEIKSENWELAISKISKFAAKNPTLKTASYKAKFLILKKKF